MENVIFELSTNLLNTGGFYCTYWGNGKSEETLNVDSIDEDFKYGSSEYNQEYFWNNFDNDKYMDDYTDIVLDHVEAMLIDVFQRFEINFTFEKAGHWSPREYNHNTDVFNFDLGVNWVEFIEKVFAAIGEQKEYFEGYLKKNYSSYDGFLSHTANNWAEWKRDFMAKEETAIGAAISFLIDRYCSEEYTEYPDNFCPSEYMYYSEYVDLEPLEDFKDDLSKRPGLIDWDNLEDWQKAIIDRQGIGCELIAEIAKENYNKPLENVISIVEEKTGCDSVNLIKSSILNVWKSIDDRTLPIFDF